MESFWNSINKVDSIRLISQWIAGVSAIVALIFSMRYSTLKKHIDLNKDKEHEQTKMELKEAREQIKDLDRAIEIRPLPFRIKEVLDKIDPSIMVNLKHGQKNFRLKLPHNLYSRLQDLCAEKSSNLYIMSGPGDVLEEGGPNRMLYGINITLTPKLLSELTEK